jgi:hypothetical protein
LINIPKECAIFMSVSQSPTHPTAKTISTAPVAPIGNIQLANTRWAFLFGKNW